MDRRTVNARCHCGTFSSSYNLPTSSIPLKSSFCHCDDCRHGSGQLFATFSVMPSSIHRPDISSLTAYHSSSNLARYFCPTCGAKVCNIEPTEWEFATGMLDNTQNLLNRVQMFVESSVDAVAASWKDSGEKRRRGRNSQEATKEHIKYLRKGALEKVRGAKSSLDASCKCGQLRFQVARPPARNAGPDKYKAFLCACTSCRMTTGFEVTAWATIPKEAIGPIEGSMKWYRSSSPVQRSFCDHCGATALFRSEGKDPAYDDVAVGLFDAESGAAAEGWLEWDQQIHEASNATDPDLVSELHKGLQRHRREEE